MPLEGSRRMYIIAWRAASLFVFLAKCYLGNETEEEDRDGHARRIQKCVYNMALKIWREDVIWRT
jgi:hypothetical protein